MSRYTMRRCRPDDSERQDDYEFCCDGKAVGRCYFMRAAGYRSVWRWTVYGLSSGGMEDTLEEAKQQFRETFEAAGGLSLFDRPPGMIDFAPVERSTISTISPLFRRLMMRAASRALSLLSRKVRGTPFTVMS